MPTAVQLYNQVCRNAMSAIIAPLRAQAQLFTKKMLKENRFDAPGSKVRFLSEYSSLSSADLDK